MKCRLQYFCVWFLLVGSYSYAQVPTYSFTFDSTPLNSVLDSLNQSTATQFFYKTDWIDTVMVSGEFSGTEEEIVKQLLDPYQIQYTRMNGLFILTSNIQVLDSLFYETESTTADNYVIQNSLARLQQNSDLIRIGDLSGINQNENALISGQVTNDVTNEPLSSALIQVKDLDASTTTDENGRYRLRLPRGSHQIEVRYPSMKPYAVKIVLISDGELNIPLIEQPRVLREVTIISDNSANPNNLKMGVETIDVQRMKNIPKVLGENDIMQTVLMLPGVQKVGEGSAGLNVRGGKTDQNLILLDHATIYNPFHFFGFFSSFDADAMGSSEIMKSSIPSEYGGRLSSLLNVNLKRANKEKVTGKLGISPVTAKGIIEVPIIKEKTSLLANVRTTYSDWIVRRADNDAIRQSDPSFNDVLLSLHHSYGNGNSIKVSAYQSNDAFRLTVDSLTNYSNKAISAEWKQLIRNDLTLSVIGGMSQYDFQIIYDKTMESAFEYGFDISDQFAKLIVDYFPSQKHNFRLGAEARLYEINQGYLDPLNGSTVVPAQLERERGLERAVFISDDYEINSQLSVSGGLRYSFFSPYGGRSINIYQEGLPRDNSSFLGSVTLGDNEFVETYSGPEARITGKYSFSPRSSIKAGITQMRQYIHAISNTSSVSPTDTWKLSDPNFAPQQSIQYSAGYYQRLTDELEFSVETYYKQLDNLLDYKLGANLVLNESLETDVLQGEGRAYGLEVLVKKQAGKLNGWFAYAYSRSEQRFRDEFPENTIDGGEFFPSNFDKPHNINLVANYKYTRRFSFSANIVYSTGRPVTYPTGKYVISGIEFTQFSGRNQFRIPDYFRVDIGVNIENSHKLNRFGYGYWNISIYNLTARRNAYSVFFANEFGRVRGYELAVLGTAIPTITYNISF